MILGTGLYIQADFEDERLDLCCLPATLEEALEEEGNKVNAVLEVGVLGIVVANKAVGCAFYAAIGVRGLGRDIEIEIHSLLEGIGLDGTVDKGVHEVNEVDQGQ